MSSTQRRAAAAVANLGWVAPAGLMRDRGTALGKPYQGNLFSAQFNTHKI